MLWWSTIAASKFVVLEFVPCSTLPHPAATTKLEGPSYICYFSLQITYSCMHFLWRKDTKNNAMIPSAF
ncbi:hypothetical protein QQP08_010507 [Theobroma cacao]|nr:hypothetical protein QQP08_010507 [Theobroma cacao]